MKNGMKIVFLSNYFNHHQKPLSEELAKISKYHFIATAKMEEERLALGWKDENPEYVVHYDEETEKADEIIKEADVVISGSAPEKLVQSCIKRGQTVFRYAERPLKNGLEPLKFIPRFIKWHLLNPGKRPIYMLCASAYTAGDYAKFGLFKNRCFKWGYFPEVKIFGDLDGFFENKEKNSILWTGRLLDWKHPEKAVLVAEKLAAEGIDFDMKIIGTGEMKKALSEMIKQKSLEKKVHLMGAAEPEKVREYMEKSMIFLFTSSRKEGWGAVVNEAMNSGCAVVTSGKAGSVPFLIEDGKNGFVCKDNDTEDYFETVKRLLEKPESCKTAGEKAYETMINTWNAKTAAERIICIAETVLEGKDPANVFKNGVCSPAEIIKEE